MAETGLMSGDPHFPDEPSCCPACAAALQWEEHPDEPNRCLAACVNPGCGRLVLVLRDVPGQQFDDPLTAFLSAPAARPEPARAAWERFYHVTLGAPWSVNWRPANLCTACGSNLTVSADFLPAHLHCAQLCRSCGHVKAELILLAQGRIERHEGSDWASPDDAVQLLRRAAFGNP